MIHSDIQAVRTAGHRLTFGSMILCYLYRLRFLTEHASKDQQAEAAAMADCLAQFARIMAEIAVGIRDPADRTRLKPVAPPVPSPPRTDEEQAILDAIACSRGQEWVDANAELILDEARALGALD